INDLPLDGDVPPIPEPPSIAPVVPLPDDGLTPAPRRLPPRRLQLRDLPPDAHVPHDSGSITATVSTRASDSVKPAVFVVPHNPLAEAMKEESRQRSSESDKSQPSLVPLPNPSAFPKLRPTPNERPAQAIADGPQTAKVTVEVSGPPSIA